MAKIKIISNPYEKQISYRRWDTSSESWVEIDKGHYNGNLKQDRMIHSFFPFIVRDVVDEIIDEFEGENIELYFEGPSDEYDILVHLVSSDEYNGKLVLQEEDRHLDNAWEVIPGVRQIFTRVDSVIRDSVSDGTIDKKDVSDDISKFSDSSGDLIPICVIGNYSAGKSTFINSLIGHEILPSGDKAVTAKVFRIFQTDEEDFFSISIKKGDITSVVSVKDGAVSYDGFTDGNLREKIESGVSALERKDVDALANKIVSVINYYVPAEGEMEYDPTMDIRIAFKGLWKEFPGKFVVIDTPGSNASSHKDHYEVLQQALSGMSNGIPVFASEYDSLDSNDNNTLKENLKKVEGLDTRFTMIIANKADAANIRKDEFNEEHEDEILNQAIPKDLYANGIYFVSSLMGLGSKINGQFIDEHGAEIYEGNKDKYTDPSNRFYKSLYQFDIMPSQVKKAAMKAAEECSDKIFVNSGLFSVENEIIKFAQKYSSYNKCEQSELFLNRMIETTADAVRNATAETDSEKEKLDKELNDETKKIKKNVTDTSKDAKNKYLRECSAVLDQNGKDENDHYSVEDLNKMKDEITKKQNAVHDMSDVEEDRKKQFNDIGDAFKNGFEKLKKKPGLDTLAAFGKSVIKETSEAAESQVRLMNTRKDVGNAVDEELIHEMNINFTEKKRDAEQHLKKTAADFWNSHTALFRQLLIETVKMTDFSDSKKNEITQVITSYKKFDYVHEDEQVFRKDEFDYLINYGDIKLIKLDRILVNQLSESYDEKITKAINDIVNHVASESYSQFENWADTLVNDVTENIVDYSQPLKELQHRIKEKEEHINVLKERKAKLDGYSDEIAGLIDWKER